MPSLDEPGVYLITCPEGKNYVGQTRLTIRERFKAHKAGCAHAATPLAEAFRRFGDAMRVKPLANLSEPAKLTRLERELIQLLSTQAPYGYNVIAGGGSFWTKAQREDAERRLEESTWEKHVADNKSRIQALIEDEKRLTTKIKEARTRSRGMASYRCSNGQKWNLSDHERKLNQDARNWTADLQSVRKELEERKKLKTKSHWLATYRKKRGDAKRLRAALKKQPEYCAITRKLREDFRGWLLDTDLSYFENTPQELDMRNAIRAAKKAQRIKQEVLQQLAA